MSDETIYWPDLKRGDVIRFKGNRLKFLSRSHDWWHFRTICGKPASVRWPKEAKPGRIEVELLYREDA